MTDKGFCSMEIYFKMYLMFLDFDEKLFIQYKLNLCLSKCTYA